MIEVFTVMHNQYSINGISISALMDLFNKNDNSVYEIGMIGKNKIVLKNKEENKFVKLECICNYFDTNNITDCTDIKKKVLCCEDCNGSCKDCYKKALQRLESGDMTLK